MDSPADPINLSTTAPGFPKTLVLSWCVPPAANGSGIVLSNLLRQFRSDEIVAVGAFYVTPQ